MSRIFSSILPLLSKQAFLSFLQGMVTRWNLNLDQNGVPDQQVRTILMLRQQGAAQR